MKKLVSILVVLAMVLSMVPAVSAAENVSGTIEAASGITYTTETWIADADGVLTVSLSSDNGLGYKTYINGTAQSLGWEGFSLTAEASYEVTAGDDVYLEVTGKTTSWGNTNSTISYSFSFAGDGVVKEAYTISEQTITTTGKTTVDMIETAEVTVVEVTPTETGVYTITVGDDALIANLGGSSAYVYDWANVSPSTSLEWTCKEVAGEYEIEFDDGTVETRTSQGQSLMLGIKSNSGTVDVTVTKTAEYVTTEIELQTYVNKAAVSEYTLPEDAALGEYVDVYGDTHTAVLGDDGYYHLDSADGAILLVDMDYICVLTDALKSDRPVMYAYVTDADGNTVKYDVAASVQAYEAVCDENGYYPLTEDLIFFYQEYAGDAGVYQFYLEGNYNADCAWMFACLTMTLPEEEAAGTPVYLNPGESWPSDGAWFAAYYWNGASSVNGWVDLTDSDADGIYEGEIPADHDNVIFVRMDPSKTDLSWDSKWNQTVDLTVPTDDNNIFVIENPWNESYSWNATGYWTAASSDDGDDTTVTGSGTEEDPYIISSLPYDIVVNYEDETAADTGVFYQYTAVEDGVLEGVALDGYDMTGVLVEVDSWAFLHDGDTVAVTAGETYLFYHFAFSTGEMGITLQYGTASEGGDTGDDGDDTGDDTVTPDSGEWSGTDVAVAADETIDIVYTPTEDGVLTVAVSCETGWQIDLVSEFNSETVWSDIGTSPVSFNLTAGTTYTISLIPYDEADGWTTCDAVMTYELTWTASSSEPEVTGSGTDEDPYSLIIDGSNHASVQEGEEQVIYFIWTATADGTLTLTFDENDPQPWITVYLGGIANKAEYDSYTVSVAVTADTTVMIGVETYDWVAAEYDFNASFASEGGDGSDEEIVYETLYDGDNYLYMDNTAGVVAIYYTYTATQTGTLYVTPTYLGYDYGWGIYDDTDWIEGDFDPNWGTYGLTINGTTPEYYYYGCVDVTEGDEVVICWYMLDETASNYQNYMTLNLNYEGYAFPEPGSEGDPYELSMYEIYYNGGEPVATYEIAAESAVYYELYNFAESYITVTGEGAYVIYNGETYTDTDGDGVVEVYADSYDMIVQIGNSGDSAAVFYINFYYPVGHVSNPEIISGNGTWTTTLGENSNGYYYQWSVGDDTLEGVMTITVSGSNGSWQYTVDNATQGIYGDYHYSTDEPAVDSENWAVFAGDLFKIGVNTAYDENDALSAGDVTITITFQEKELVEGTDYPYYVSYYDVLPVEITVAAGEDAWVELDGFRDYYFTVTGEGAYVAYDGTTYTDDDGDGVVKVKINDYTATVHVGNTSDAEVTYSLNVEIPLGDSSNPQIITENGEYSTSEFADGSTNQYYFQYIPTEDGTITVEVLNDTYWQINLWNKTSYASAGSNYKYATSNTFTLNVSAGDIVQIYGRTYSYDTYANVAGTLSFNFTFEAAPEDTSEGITLYDGDNDVYTDNTDGGQTATKYTYVATQSGTLYLTLSGGSYTTSYGTYEANKTQLMNYTTITVNGQALTNGYCGTIEVAEGDEVTITWKVKYAYYKYLYEANLNLSYEGYNPAPGSEADPYELSSYDCPTETVEIAAGSTVYYSLKYFSYSYFTVTGAGASIVYNGETYTDTDGDGVVMLYVESSPTVIQIGNSGDSAAVFAVGQYYPVGHQMNPVIIESEGAYAATVDGSGDAYYFEFEADCDSDLTLTFNSELAYQYAICVNGASWDESAGDWNYMGAWNAHTGEFTTITFELMQGDYVQIIVNTQYVTEEWDTEGLYGYYPAGSIDMDVELEYHHVDDDEDGFCDLCGEDLSAPTVVLGDVDGDGDIDIFDANLIVAYYNEIADLSEEQLAAADVDGDGDIDIFDANFVVAYYNETIDAFPAEEK